MRAALTFPPTPAAPPRGEAGGDEQSSSDPAPASHQITPLPQRGRGAGGEGGPHLPPAPPPLPRCGRGGGRMMLLTFPPAPFPRQRCGNGRGRGAEQGRCCAGICQQCRVHHLDHPSPAVRERAGGEGGPSPGSPFIHGAKVCWTPSRNDCTGTGHAQ